MKYALIVTYQDAVDPNTEAVLGKYVTQVEETPFEVHPSLVWLPCGDEVVGHEWYYDESNNTFGPIPQYIAPMVQQPTTTGTQTL